MGDSWSHFVSVFDLLRCVQLVHGRFIFVSCIVCVVIFVFIFCVVSGVFFSE